MCWRFVRAPDPMASLLAQYLDPARIVLALQPTERIAAIDAVARLLQGHPDVTDYAGLYDDLLAREQLDTTCLGNEVAIPHARTRHVRRIVMAVGRSGPGVWFENSRQTVRLMFVLATPQANPGDYLRLVGLLCRLLKEPANRAALLQAPSPEAFAEAMLALEARLHAPAPV